MIDYNGERLDAGIKTTSPDNPRSSQTRWLDILVLQRQMPTVRLTGGCESRDPHGTRAEYLLIEYLLIDGITTPASQRSE